MGSIRNMSEALHALNVVGAYYQNMDDETAASVLSSRTSATKYDTTPHDDTAAEYNTGRGDILSDPMGHILYIDVMFVISLVTVIYAAHLWIKIKKAETAKVRAVGRTLAGFVVVTIVYASACVWPASDGVETLQLIVCGMGTVFTLSSACSITNCGAAE
jgi:hypothetical protein